MENLINERIAELETYVTNLRTVIAVINNEILEKGFVPDEQQKNQIAHYASQGRKALEDIITLENQLKQILK